MLDASGDDFVGYTSADVRRFLVQAFSDEEIVTFCFDFFPETQNDFSAGMPKGEKIRQLIAYCQQHDLAPQLFAALQGTRPDQYRQFFGALPPPAQFEPGPVVPSESLGAGLSLQANEVLLDRLIANQHRAARYYLLFAAALVALGLAVSVGGLALPGEIIPLSSRPFFGMGGIFVASLSAFQFKEVFNRREKVGVLESLRGGLVMATQAPGQTGADVQQRIGGLLWQVLEKAVVG